MSPSPSQWKTFRGGEQVRCPECNRRIGDFGLRLIVQVRVHPNGLGARPTNEAGLSQRCPRSDCGAQLEYQWDTKAAP